MIIGAISTGIGAAIGGAALIAGTVLSYYLWQVVLRNRRKKIIAEAEAEAEVIKKEKILQAKERFLQLKAEHEKVINEKNNRIIMLDGFLYSPKKPKRDLLKQIEAIIYTYKAL